MAPALDLPGHEQRGAWMEREVTHQKHPLLHMSIECREKRAHCQLVSTGASPPHLEELNDSAPLVISYTVRASLHSIELLYSKHFFIIL